MNDIPEVSTFLHNSKNIPYPGRLASIDVINSSCRHSLSVLRKIGVNEELRISPTKIGRTGPSIPAGTILTEYVLGVKKAFEGLGLSPLDRNPEATLVECPVLYYNGMVRTFNGIPDFEHINKTDHTILTEMKKEYKKEKLHKIAKWDNKGVIQNAFIMSKDKDIEKKRPICPSFASPLRFAGRFVVQCLNCFFRNFKGKNFNLSYGKELKEDLNNINRRIEQDELQVIAQTFDIKEMFSQIPHEEVQDAVHWIIGEFKNKGKHWIRYKTRGKGATFCKSAQEKGWKSIRLNDIDKLVNFILKNVVFKSVGTVLKQNKGVPMGGQASPPLANLVCMFSENKFLKSLGKDERFIHGKRYFYEHSPVSSFCSECRDDRSGLFLEAIVALHGPSLVLPMLCPCLDTCVPIPN
ncbi:hypothetical protein CBR_g46625 [Chara braunii]|uniref:Reverse transcriptase domain-containing protein n=1 Tax=Chara braunii TaxID=69332 RepID=A0A388M0N9_CHABU|nr:hypothetical protein CBR_g46625 [Chara braunii]|eukprot:GBG88137.1 hypothetical protein CBR_g46625 [Chara braunii]